MDLKPEINIFSIIDLPAPVVGVELKVRIQIWAKNEADLYVDSEVISAVIADVPSKPINCIEDT